MKNSAIGSSFDSFLDEENIKDEVETNTVKKIIALQMQQIMANERLTKSSFAQRMGTSRAGVDRLLDPNNDSVTLHSLKRAASAMGKQLRVELV
jgi:DNA-binding Xre family transcriptional regulator